MIEVRAMELDDIEAVSEIRVSGWRAAYAGILPRSYLGAGAGPRRRATGGQPFAVEDVVVTGWAALGPRAGASAEGGAGGEGGAGELYALYVRPDVIGTGTGRRLMAAVRERAMERRFRRLELCLVAENVRARRFYARAGLAPDGGESVEEYDGVPIRDLRYAGGLGAPA